VADAPLPLSLPVRDAGAGSVARGIDDAGTDERAGRLAGYGEF
jgi:hypothetical protein